jgi:hypothetical protein
VTTTAAQRDKTTVAKTSALSTNIAAVKNAIATFKTTPTVNNGIIMAITVAKADQDLADAKAAIDRFYGAGTPIAPGVNPDSTAGVAAIAGLT